MSPEPFARSSVHGVGNLRTLRSRVPGAVVRLAVLAGAAGLAWSAGHGAPATERLYARARAASVEILIDGRHSGSGCFVGSEGRVLTAAHLFERPDDRLELLHPDGRRTAARRLAIDRGHDLALLQAEGATGRIEGLVLARRSPRVGDEILQLGAPIFRSGLLQPGRVAAAETMFEFYGGFVDYTEIVPVAAMMQGGTSGGPWLNARGEVVGVQSGVMSLENRPVGVAFMSPLAPLRTLMHTARDAATPALGLGVDELWQQPAESLARRGPGTAGLVVSVVRPDGPAARAGLQPEDLLAAAQGAPLVRISDLLRRARSLVPGESLRLEVHRVGESAPRRLTLILGVAEAWWPAAPAVTVSGANDP